MTVVLDRTTALPAPHGDRLVTLSGTAVRGLLARGQLPPREFSRPEVARLLATGYRDGGGGPR